MVDERATYTIDEVRRSRFAWIRLFGKSSPPPKREVARKYALLALMLYSMASSLLPKEARASSDADEKIARQAAVVSERLVVLGDRVIDAFGEERGAANVIIAIGRTVDVLDRIAGNPEFFELQPIAIQMFQTAIGAVEGLLPFLEPPGDALIGALAGAREAELKLLRLWERPAVETHWVIPADVLLAGDLQDVERTEGGAWTGSSCTIRCAIPPISGCAGGFRPGAAEFSWDLIALFPQITNVAGYCCRDICEWPPSGEMSVHGTGRALDLFIDLDGDEANSVLGDPVANWLVEHAEEIGIQLVIWHRWIWIADESAESKSQPFLGLNPHIDHIHAELSLEGGEGLTPWFASD